MKPLEVRIDVNGKLWIKRGGEFVEQVCIYKNSELCSHQCPCFGEPKKEMGIDSIGKFSLPLCLKELPCEELIDERVIRP